MLIQALTSEKECFGKATTTTEAVETAPDNEPFRNLFRTTFDFVVIICGFFHTSIISSTQKSTLDYPHYLMSSLY